MGSRTIETVDETGGDEDALVDPGPPVSWRDCMGPNRRALLVFLAAGLSLVLLHASGVGLDSLHVLGLGETLNDQVVYVDAARHLLAEGELTTGMIYPSTLLQDFGRNFLYMPGHAAAIAVSIAIFGDTASSAIGPNLIAHLACLACLYLCGRRLVNRAAGAAAAAAFAMTPILLVYTFSGMAETTTLAACLIAFTIFVHLKGPGRAWIAPLLLVGPFLFRETSAFWIVPMVVWLLADSEMGLAQRWRAAGVAFVGSFVTLVAVYRLGWIADRPSLFAQNLLGRTFLEKYADAVSLSGVELDAGLIARATLELAMRNLGELFDLLTTMGFESLTLHALLWVPMLGALLAWRTPRLRPLVLAWAGLFLVTFVFATLFYRWSFFIGVRQLLPPAMLGMLVVGAAGVESSRHASARSLVIAGALLWLVSGGVVLHQAGLVTQNDGREANIRRLLANVSIPERGVLLAHHNLGLLHLFDHPSSQVSFVPANRVTLELLEQRFDVRAALLVEAEIARLTPSGLRAVGLQDAGRISAFRFLREPEAAPPAAP